MCCSPKKETIRLLHSVLSYHQTPFNFTHLKNEMKNQQSANTKTTEKSSKVAFLASRPSLWFPNRCRRENYGDGLINLKAYQFLAD